MDFSAIKKMLDQKKLQEDENTMNREDGGPIDLGNTSDMANNMAVRKSLDDVVGSDDSLDANSKDKGLMLDRPAQVSDSPIDYMGAAAGAKLGGAMARDAGSILGNNIGAVGSNIKKAADLAPEAVTSINDLARNSPQLLRAIRSKDSDLIKRLVSNSQAGEIKAATNMAPKKVFEEVSPVFGKALDEAKAKVQTLDQLGHGMYSPEMRKALSELDVSQANFDKFLQQKESVNAEKQRFGELINKIRKPTN